MTQKEAIKILRETYDNALFSVRTALATLILELQENEDEKIRKEIIKLVNFFYGSSSTYKHLISADDMIAWLEKQGEQKPTDKVEPKFREGDWVVQGYNILKIRCVGNEYYCFETVGGYVDDMLVSEIDSLYHLWTIQDAKDGDVLACENGWTCIFKTLVNNETFSSYCFMDNTKWFCEIGSECHTLKEEFVKAYNGKIYPATQEQRKLLFQKIHEAGYEWDAEKLELKKIEVVSKEMEDERIKREILELVSIAGNGNQFEEIKDWLEKQGEHKPGDMYK